MPLTFKLTESPPQPSISVVQLNDTLVQMRTVVRTAKVYAARHMLRYIHAIKTKLSKNPDNLRFRHKLDHRLSELHTLRHLSVVRLCKLILANENSRSELSAVGHKLSEQDRLIIRLSAEKPVAKFVREFREAHPDWRSLVHYLLYKNISGKWKSREQKKRNRKVHGALPLPPIIADVTQLEKSPEEDTESTNSIRYRVPVSNVSEADDELHHELLVEEKSDIDSDVASDIAEEVISRLIAKKRLSKQVRPQTAAVEHLGTLCTSVESSETAVKDAFRCVVSMEPGDTQPPKQEQRRAKFPKVKKLDIIKVPLATKKIISPEPDSVPTFPPVDAAEMAGDSDLLGSDDIVMRTKFTRKFHRNGPPPSVRSRRGRSHTSFRMSEFPNNRKSSGAIPKQLTRHSFSKDKRRRPADPVLHPSWQAKREQKLKTKLHSVNLAPTAKHIIFDD